MVELVNYNTLKSSTTVNSFGNLVALYNVRSNFSEPIDFRDSLLDSLYPGKLVVSFHLFIARIQFMNHLCNMEWNVFFVKLIAVSLSVIMVLNIFFYFRF